MAVAFQCLSCAPSEPFLTGRQSVTLPFQRKPLFRSVLFSRARNLSFSIVAASSKKKSKKKLSHDYVTEGDEEDEDAFELLFKQLEEDLKNDDLSKDDSEDEITEEDIALFERELEDALGDYDTELLNSDVNNTETGNDPEHGDDDDGDEKSLKLRNWQLKKLARALKAGRRKTNDAIISSIVHVTNIPRRRVVEWFEDKRAEEGVPDRRLPYQRSVPETA